MFRYLKICLTLQIILCATITGCNNLQTRIKNADELANKNNFIKKIVSTEKFNIVSYQKINSSSDDAVIYIEGDGLSWLNKYRISDNPTPVNPVALELATLDQSPNVIYLGRPCQYQDIKTEISCTPDYWTNKRASYEIIHSIDTAISKIVNHLNIKKIRLVGYSGGGTIAAILAATRKDVIDLRTIAGNLDIDTFSKIHNVSPLSDSLNPIDYAEKLVKVPQVHFVSTNDDIIKKEITASYIQNLKKYDNNLGCVKLIESTTSSHSTGWTSIWRNNLSYNFRCN